MSSAEMALRAWFRATALQFMRFSAVGAVGTLVHYVILVSLVSGMSTEPVLSTVIGSAAGAITNYVLNYHWTFGSSKRHAEAAPKFFVVALVSLGINAAVMDIGTQTLHLHYIIAQVLATGIALGWNFAGSRWWTF